MSFVFKLGRASAVIAFVVGMGVAGEAQSASMTMSPNRATVDAFLGKDFHLRLDSGDIVTNTLNFTVQGNGGCGILCPSTAMAMIVFDGTTVLSASDTDSGLFSSGNVVRGLLTTNGAVAGLLIDTGAPSSESFRLTLRSTPTTATLYSLNLSSLSSINTTRNLLSRATESTRLTFSVVGGSPAVPEPSAALVFGAGLMVTALGIRRRA